MLIVINEILLIIMNYIANSFRLLVCFLLYVFCSENLLADSFLFGARGSVWNAVINGNDSMLLPTCNSHSKSIELNAGYSWKLNIIDGNELETALRAECVYEAPYILKHHGAKMQSTDLYIKKLNKNIVIDTDVKYAFSMQSICSNFYFDIGITEKFKSYLGFGVGLLVYKSSATVDVSSKDLSTVSRSITDGYSDTSIKPFWNISIGASYIVNDRILLDFIKYEYRNTGSLTIHNIPYGQNYKKCLVKPDNFSYSSLNLHRFSTGITIRI
ncbi:hypothetical protein Cyrtocomes_00935 [Candidatus Cyrtobacter comes]|uniref:Outer membrane protein beta-barrel domain-containing protein n=1 Tax=Candidatus Cyrtobacter comes TaxID=675776 RepID=A0ABU5L934_9RICK|nr:hypothetical protein [Candidatus Cyrtobacter comes]MDZ5762547.1 hypothetical protein [Candidatus Cyrtobacter comes]